MKLLSPFVGLLLVGLLITATKADISLTLRNKQQQQQYLPPPIQEISGNTQQQQTFQEKKYANSRYQIFEVHNHYEPSTSNGIDEQTRAVNREYLPPQEEEIHIQHVNAPADFPFDDPNLDESYLSFASDSDSNNQQIIVKHETRIVAANNRPSNNIPVKHIQSNHAQSNNIPQHNVPVPFPSSYQHKFPKKPSSLVEYLPPTQNIQSSRRPAKPRQNIQRRPQQQQQHVVNNFNAQQQTQQFSQQNVAHQAQHHVAQQPFPQSNPIKGKDYLPPISTQSVVGRRPVQNVVQNPSKGPDYLPPHQKGFVKQNTGFKGPEISVSHQTQTPFQQNTGFKGPEISIPQQQSVVPQQSVAQQQNSPFKGPDYIPPHRQNSVQHQQPINQQNSPVKGPDYLPPHQDVSVRQQTSFQQNSPFKGPDYLPPHQHNSAPVQQQTSFLPSSSFKGPDYLPPHQKSPVQQQHTSFQPSVPFKGPDYLPPHQNAPVQQQHHQQQQTSFRPSSPFKGPDYLPPHQNHVPQHQEAAPLPSGYDFQKPENSEQAIAELHTLPEQSPQYQQEVTVGTQIQVSGREQSSDIIYGTPNQASPPNGQQPQQEYLPPGYDFQKPENSEQAIQELHSLEPSEPRQNQISTTFKASEYLPPDYIAPKPENSEQAITELHTLPQTGPSISENKAGGYLPPGYEFQKPAEVEQPINQNYQNQQNFNQNLGNQQQVQAYNQAPQQSFTQALVTQQSQSYQTQSHQTQASQQQSVQQSSQGFKGSDYLPPVAAAPQSRSLDFKAPDYLPPVTSSQPQLQQITQPSFQPQLQQITQPLVQPFKGNDYLPPQVSSSSNYQASQQAPQFKAPDYLPPVTSSQPQLQQITQPIVPAQVSSSIHHQAPQQQPQFKASDYLPPVTPTLPQLQQITQPIVPPQSSSPNYQAPQQAPQFKAPDYLPPTVATHMQPIQPTIMYPLSSYMTTVQPHERYGNARKPFPEYGPPPTTAHNDVSPMYREPATRPKYYAPTMSYSNHAVNTQTYSTYTQNLQQQSSSSAFNQQTRQTLQTFMPKDIRQEVSHNQLTSTHTALGAKTALQTSKPAGGKIRTVQIVNQANVKTLKVLESLDNAGVKTIKILGHSNEQPMGDHRIVKVVSGHGQTEQTVKIFNDQQDVDQSSQSNSQNGYLPPRHKRNPKKSSSSKGRRRI